MLVLDKPIRVAGLATYGYDQINNVVVTIEKDKVVIEHKTNVAIRGKYIWAQFYYEIVEGTVQWKECVSKVQRRKDSYLQYAIIDVFKGLREMKKQTIDKWMKVQNRVPIRPGQIADKVKEFYEPEIYWYLTYHRLTKQKSQQEKMQMNRVFISENNREFAKKNLQKLKSEPEDCSICLQIMDINNSPSTRTIHQLKCGHIFHYKCIRNYCINFKNQCPFCKYDPFKP